jgi:hypothetical protein
MKSFYDHSLDLFMSRNLRRAIIDMKVKIASVMAGKDSDRDQIRYLSYSAHDSNVIGLLSFLDPLWYSPVDQPTSSSFIFELHYNASCVEKTPSNACFFVEVLNNGISLQFDTCVQGNIKRGDSKGICQFDDFLAHIDKRRYPEETDLGALCEEPYPRPPKSTKAFLF